MDGPTECPTEWSMSEREQILHTNTYMWNLVKWYRWAYLQSLDLLRACVEVLPKALGEKGCLTLSSLFLGSCLNDGLPLGSRGPATPYSVYLVWTCQLFLPCSLSLSRLPFRHWSRWACLLPQKCSQWGVMFWSPPSSLFWTSQVIVLDSSSFCLVRGR